MHDYFFNHSSPLADNRLFGCLGNLNDLLLSGCKVGVRGRAIDRPAFDRDLLLAQAHRFLYRLLFDTAEDAHVTVFDFAFAYGDVFFHHRNRDFLLTLSAPGARSLVLHTGRGACLPLGSTCRGSCARRWSGRYGVGVITGPVLLPPLHGTLMYIDRVQSS
jgi:hypothetical protein